MNILIVSQHFYPEKFKINEIATELVKRGHSVDVVTGLPNYPKGEIYDGYKDRLVEKYFGITIYRTKIRPRHNGSLNLFLNYMSFMFKAKRTVRKIGKKIDVVFCFQTSPIFQLTPAIYAKNYYKCPLVLMCCDQWPESLKARGISKGPIFRIIHRYCVKNLSKCNHILNVAPSFIEYNHKINKVPLQIMSWLIQPADDFGLQNEPTNKTTIDLIFAGNIGYVQNVDSIVRAYSTLRYDNLFIHIFGDGSCKQKCEKLAKEEHVDTNVIFYGMIPSDELKTKFANMDACLLTLSGKSEIGNTIPSKLISYLSTGKPVLAALSGDARKIIEKEQCGLCCEPDDYKELAKIIDDFYQNKQVFLKYGQNGRQYFEENCTLLRFIDSLVAIFENQTKVEL